MKSKINFRYRHYVSFLVIVVSFFTESAFTQSIPEFYIVNTSPSSVFFYDSLRQNFDLVLIDNNPTMAVLEPSGQLLYILHDGLTNATSVSAKDKTPKQPSSLSIIDVTTKEFLKKIPLGWRAAKMEIVNDSNLVIFGAGMPRMGERKNNTELGFVTVINARRGNIISSTNLWRWVKNIAWTKDLSRIIVFGANEFSYVKPFVFPWQYTISILNTKGEIINEIKLPRLKKLASITNIEFAFSKDQSWLYLFDPGEKSNKRKKSRDAEIFVIDLKTGKLAASHDLGTPQSILLCNQYNGNVYTITMKFPTKNQIQISRLDGIQINTQIPINSKANQFFPNEEPGGILAIDNGQMTFIPDNIDSTRKQIDFKPSQNSLMTNVLWLPLKGRSVVFSGPNEYSLIDEFQNKIINTGTTGREGVRAAKLLGETVLALGVSLTGSLLLGNPYVFIPETRPSFLYALARADEEFLYVFNTSSNDITIINTENGSIEDIIPVGANCKGISITPDGKYVFAINSSRVTIINTETNKEHTEIKLETNLGIIKDLQFVDKSGNLVVLFENAVQFWDIGQGEATLILPLTSKPEFLICPTFR